MNRPPVTVIVPNHNDSATLAACIRSITTNTDYPDWQLIVVDDESTDRSLEVLRQFPNVKVQRIARGGAAKAVNVGLSLAKGRDIVRVHADVVIETANWLTQLVDTAYSNPKIGVLGTRLVFPDGRIYSEGRSIISGLGFHPLHRNRLAFQADGAAGKLREVDAVSGAFAYYKREAIEAVGNFDENYGAAWIEDEDFCIGARRLGFKVFVAPNIKAVHYTRSHPPTWAPFAPNCEAELVKLTCQYKSSVEQLQAQHWEKKWGWNPVFPDIGEIRRIYGNTEICWQIGEALRFKPSSSVPTVDCCLVTWNTLPLLRRCLESLATTDYPAEKIKVYVADNGSTDGTLAYLEELKKSYRFEINLVSLAVNTGAAVGVNFAVAHGKGDLVARLDDDIVLPANWLKVLVEDLFNRPFAGCVGPKIVNDNPTNTIQCGPYRHFPVLYGHDDEADLGQANYLSRSTHVRGCCNLYRRDVFARCGMLDLRYSPSQFDDPDHHIALLNAGYEIIYDGRVSVVHKLNSGLGRTSAALANQRNNMGKMFGKWGNDVFEILERSIDLSREGRYLPDDGNTNEWMSFGAALESFPNKTSAVTPNDRKLTFAFYHELTKADGRKDVQEWLSLFIINAQLRARDGAPRYATDILLAASNFAPAKPEIYTNLAEIYLNLGQKTMAEEAARRGLHLLPNDPQLTALRERALSTDNEKQQLLGQIAKVNLIGESSVTLQTNVPFTQAKHMRVLMVNTFEPRVSGGDMHQLKKTRQYLQNLGVEVDVCCSPRPNPKGYDLVHVWNTWFPYQTLPQIKAIRAAAPEIPIALSTIYWDMKEKNWADHAVPHLFATAPDASKLREGLAQLAADRLAMNGRTRSNAAEPVFRGFEVYQKQLINLVDHLLPQSELEVKKLKETLGIEKPYTVVYNGAETAVFDKATPDWFISNYKLKDFVLTVGLVEPRKNQLMLLHSLRDTGIPVVVLGRHYDHGYYQLCKKYAPRGSIFIDHLPHEQLASAYKAAKVHALPSWMECAAFANVEAALCGTALAVSNRTSETEYFGNNAYFCDPADSGSICTAVVNAYRNHAADALKRAQLLERFRTQYTWENAAQATLKGFEAAIAGRRRQRAAA